MLAVLPMSVWHMQKTWVMFWIGNLGKLKWSDWKGKTYLPIWELWRIVCETDLRIIYTWVIQANNFNITNASLCSQAQYKIATSVQITSLQLNTSLIFILPSLLLLQDTNVQEISPSYFFHLKFIFSSSELCDNMMFWFMQSLGYF